MATATSMIGGFFFSIMGNGVLHLELCNLAHFRKFFFFFFDNFFNEFKSHLLQAFTGTYIT